MCDLAISPGNSIMFLMVSIYNGFPSIMIQTLFTSLSDDDITGVERGIIG